ncbi:hypothetical protein ACFQ3Z_06925 [Streptomyces nogalater]
MSENTPSQAEGERETDAPDTEQPARTTPPRRRGGHRRGDPDEEDDDA